MIRMDDNQILGIIDDTLPVLIKTTNQMNVGSWRAWAIKPIPAKGNCFVELSLFVLDK